MRDDLFQPTLREVDDIHGIDRPWNPTTLVLMTFFFGIVAGGILIASNERRLSLPGKTRIVWTTIACFAITILVAAYAVPSRAKDHHVDLRDISYDRDAPLKVQGAQVVRSVERAVKESKESSESDQRRRLLVRGGLRALGLVAALWLTADQRRRFRLVRMHDLPRGKILWPALGAIAAGSAATFVMSFVAAMLLI